MVFRPEIWSRLIGLVLCIVAVPDVAAAWCLRANPPMIFDTFWADQFPDRKISVFISIEGDSSFLHAGFSLIQAESMVRRMVAVHNETVGPPFLAYAGVTELGLSPDALPLNRPAGITIESFSCEKGGDSQVFPCADAEIACTSSPSDAVDLISKERVIFRPSSAMCPKFGHGWGLDFKETDTTAVLLHEFGHALGLGHSDDFRCAGPTDGMGGAGVMARPPSAFRAYGRDWRRDDIEGLRAVYGADFKHAVYSWEDLVFPLSPVDAAGVPVCVESRTPPGITSMVVGEPIGAPQVIGFTNTEDRVAHRVRVGNHFIAPAGGVVVDGSDHGVSFAPVAIAQGGSGPSARLVLLWSADESKVERSNRLRWAMRDVDGEAWSYGYLETPDGESQNSNDVAVGFDPGNQLFIVTSITKRANPYFLALDLTGEQVGAPTVFGEFMVPPFVFDIGKASCFIDAGVSRCVVPYTSADYNQVDGPLHEIFRNGWFDVEVAPDGAVTLVEDVLVSDLSDLPSRGMVDLASGPDGFRGVVADRRYELERDPGIGSTNTPALSAGPFQADDWPLRIGSRQLDGSTGYTLVARRLEPMCGNGTLDCSEQCDDGNVMDGDGCSVACELESSDTTGDLPTTSGGATSDDSALTGNGGGPTGASTPTEDGAGSEGGGSSGAGEDTWLPQDDGCGCRGAQPRGGALTGLLFLPLLCRRRAR